MCLSCGCGERKGVQSKPVPLVQKLRSASFSSPFHSHWGYEQVRALVPVEKWICTIITQWAPTPAALQSVTHPFTSCFVLSFPNESSLCRLTGWFFENKLRPRSLAFFVSATHRKKQCPTVRAAKTTYKNAKIAWRKGLPWNVSDMSFEQPMDVSASLPHSTWRADLSASGSFMIPIIKQVHLGGSSLANIKEKNEESGPYLAHRFSLLCCPPACFSLPLRGNLFAVKLLKSAGERICSCTCPFQRSSINNK